MRSTPPSFRRHGFLWPLFQVVAALAALTVLAATAPARAGSAMLDHAMRAVLVVHTADAADRFRGSAFRWQGGEVAVTNAHVVGDASEVRLTDHAGRRVTAEVIARDPVRDVAVISLVGLDFDGPGLALGPLPGLGAPVWALGAPLGLDFTATRGTVSARARQVETAVPLMFLQHDAAVNPGSSGGPLLDGEGRLVGMNSQIADGSRHYIGIAYAIAAPDLARIVDGLVAETLPPFPRLGMQLRPVGRQVAAALGIAPGGALVDRVDPGSLAARAGLLPGDVIMVAGGAKVAGPGALAFAVDAALEAGTLDLTVRRGDQALSISLPLVADTDARLTLRDTAGAEAGRVAAYSLAALGIRLDDGGRVTRMTQNSPALLAGMSEGDTILAVNGQAMTPDALATLELRAAALFLIAREGGATRHVMVDPWDRTLAFRPIGGANVLDPDVVVF